MVDAVGGPMFEPCLGSLALHGRQVALTSVGSRRVEFDLLDFYHNSSRLLGIDTMQLSGPAVADILNRLSGGFAMGRLSPPSVTSWPLTQAKDAYGAVGRGGTQTRQIVVPSVQ